MDKEIKIIRGSISASIDPDIESLSMEVWRKTSGDQILRIGRYDGIWKVTLTETVEIRWEDFEEIFGRFTDFVRDENKAIEQEQGNS